MREKKSMSIFASILRAVYRLSGVKKSFTLPENELRKEIEKQNRHRGVFTPTDHKAYYEMDVAPYENSKPIYYEQVMLLQVILEGLGLGALLALVCAVGIRKGAVGMVHLYSPAVQQRCVKLGLTTHEKIKRNSQLFKAVCIPGYIGYVLVCVYGINGAKGFAAGFWQLLVILSVMNLIDRFLIDGYWVGHTNAWTIPGTEDLKPYITAKDKQKKWLFGTVGMAGIAAVLAVLMTAFIH